MSERTRIDITASDQVSAIVYPAAHPKPAGIRLILAHGAGASQSSGFMVRFATALAERGFATLTFNFLYTEQGRRAPDRNDKLEACYRRVIETCRGGLVGGKGAPEKLVIGGKSMGGRIASQVAATDPSGIAGLVLLGYPLHPPGQPEKLRTKHLADIRVPALFVQGSRDTFGTPAELEPHLAKLNAPAHLYVVEGGDHSFKVRKQTGLSQEQVYVSVLDEIERWLHGAIGT
jgi:uncharacterized protein